MSEEKSRPTSDSYEEFVCQREEILKHKWIASEKSGHDIGFEAALIDWVKDGRDGWLAARKKMRGK